MKKQTEKPPIDDLFARKLGNASLRPGANGFERLQARMKPNQREAKVIFWQNTTMQRYAALAACLLIVAGFGWLYRLSGNSSLTNGTQLANNRTLTSKPQNKPEAKSVPQPSDKALPESPVVNAVPTDGQTRSLPTVERGQDQLANAGRTTDNVKKQRSTQPVSPIAETVVRANKPSVNEPIQKLANSAAPTDKPDNAPGLSTPVNTVVADASTRKAPAERVLVVTIAEPEALVVARQAAQASVENQPTVAAATVPQKETKVGSLWQQVKRVKQGEVFARRNDNDEESGLLSRAYNGLKHSLDKDKPVKQ